MRVAVIGGTEFIGPAIVEELLRARHEPTIVHRGKTEPPGLPDVPHVHCDRRDSAALRRALREVVRADAVIDTCAYGRADSEALVGAPRPGARVVVLSSMDVYRAFGSVLAGAESDPVPLDEDSPLRVERYVMRGQPRPPRFAADPDTYEKIEVEEVSRRAGALLLRLPVVFGPRDPLRREEPILRRVRAGRERIPFGAGNLLWTQGFVGDVANAARLGIEEGGLEGAVLNVGYRRTVTVEQWARKVLAAAGSSAQLVRVPDAAVPADLAISRTFKQHMIVESSRARHLLGWRETDYDEAIVTSVRWHQANPPAEPDADFAADDEAFAAAEKSRTGSL